MNRIHVIGGGTFSHVRNHLALAAPAFGETARAIAEMLEARSKASVALPEPAATWTYQSAKMGVPEHTVPFSVHLHLTKMADPRNSKLVTNEDVEALVDALVAEPSTAVIFMSAAMCDFDAEVVDFVGINALMPTDPKSGKYATRLKTREKVKMYHPMGGEPVEVVKQPLLQLTASQKVISRIRKERKDIFVVGFKTTAGATEQEQYLAGLNLLKENSLNLVLANDTVTRVNMVITPEESRYHVTTDRKVALDGLVDMVLARSSLHFTRSTVVGSEADLVPWTDERVPTNLREVVNYCVKAGAYKPFRGSTAGHFAVKLADGSFLTSRRKTNYNEDLRLVRVEADGDDRVVAYGARPSVGGQSQRIVFQEHPETDCIVHAHVPLRPDAPDVVRVQDQWPYECGSMECGRNTSGGLTEHVIGKGRVKAVMLDNHGPNIVFSRDTPAAEVIRFIERNFDLSAKTGGPVA